MTLKQLTSIAMAFAAGFALALFIFRDVTSRSPHAKHDERLSTASVAEDKVATLRADYERQIADLKTQLEAARSQASVAGSNLPAPVTVLERMKLDLEERATRRAAALKLETDKLLAAGFTMNRIEWIRKRTEELVADFRRKDDQLLQQGKRDVTLEQTHDADSDIDLRYELGDDEYARYRQAVGRPIGMMVGEVLSGGFGESAGLKVGDEIIAYNGARVFNVGELNRQLIKYENSGASMAVDVMRDGQKIRLTAAAGNMRIQPAYRVPTRQDLERGSKSLLDRAADVATKIEAARANDGAK